ncbi:MAG: ABC transporter substrate-binding protein, partial [Proteocatella sp.]
MKRILALTLTAVLGMSLLSGCSSNNSGGSDVPQTVVHNLSADPASIDPALNEAVDGSHVLQNAFEGLTRTDAMEQPIEGIAESWDISEDGLTYTFHLRDSKWSDGE